jgi:hypothetical protein
VGDRTPDLRIANAALCQTELLPHVESILGSGGESCQGSDRLIALIREPMNSQISRLHIRLGVGSSLVHLSAISPNARKMIQLGRPRSGAPTMFPSNVLLMRQ